MKEHTLALSNYMVRYWEHRPTTPRATLVLVHGFRGDHHGLAQVAALLPDYRILSPDLPGFGQSPRFPERSHDIAGYSEFLQEFFAGLDLPAETVLLGHSFGSIVASHFAAQHPERISRLVLINPIASPALEGPRGFLSQLARLYYRLGAKLPEPVGQALLRSKAITYAMSVGMAKSKDPELRRFIHGQHLSHFSSFADREQLLEAFDASITATVRDVASQLSMPTLLIAGERDEIVSPAEQKALQKMIPDARLVMIADVGHLIHYETPQIAATAITEFLEPTQSTLPHSPKASTDV